MPKIQGEMPQKAPWLRSFINRSSWWFLGIVALVWTFGFAGAYARFTVANRGNGIKLDDFPEYSTVRQGKNGHVDERGFSEKLNPVPLSVAAPSSIYFSIASLTTVGYGDLVPHGFSRVLACIEALGGLMIAGVFVTKITTGMSGKTKYYVSKIEGKWVEFSFVKEEGATEDCLIISLITLQYIGDALRYDGHNYTCKGKYRRGFQGRSQPLSTINDWRVLFEYSNLKGDKADFKEGRTELQFDSFDGNRFQTFVGKAEDTSRDNDIPMFGYRASKVDADVIDFWDNDERKKRARCLIATAAYSTHKREIERFAESHGIILRPCPEESESGSTPSPN